MVGRARGGPPGGASPDRPGGRDGTGGPGDTTAAVLERVAVRYGRRLALDDVTLTVGRGTHVEVRGPNGSGKSTLLRVLAGACPPSAGRRGGPRPVAFVPAALEPPALSPATWLHALGVPTAAVAESLRVLGFNGALDEAFRHLSYGNGRKVLLAGALCTDASLVVIEEGREGLDDRGRAGLEALVGRRTAAGVAVVVADQGLAAVPDGARAVHLAGGRVVADSAGPAGDPAASVVGGDGGHDVVVSLSGPAGSLGALADAARPLGFRLVDGGTGDEDDGGADEGGAAGGGGTGAP